MKVDWVLLRQRLFAAIMVAVMEILFCLWILTVFYFLVKRGK